jgi:hypothetical protein
MTRNLLKYQRRERDFQQLFVREYKSILNDINEDLKSIEEDLKHTHHVQDRAELLDDKNTLLNIKKQYNFIILKNLN